MENDSHSETFVITNCILNVPSMLISIIGNSLILAAILRTPCFRSVPSFIYLCGLTVSDLFVGFVVQQLYIASEITSRRISFLYSASHVTVFFACGVSLCTMTALSVDRFMALHYHMRYATIVTKAPVIYALVTIWLTDALLSSIYFENWKASYIIMASGIVICVFFSTLSSIRIYRVVRRRQLQIQDKQIARQSYQFGLQLKLIPLKKSAINTFVFYIFILFRYIPKSLSLILSSFFPTKWADNWLFANTFVFYSSSVNPVLYCWRIRELRIAVLNL